MGLDVKTEGKAAHDRGLLLIGLFKLSKAVFFFCIGVGAIRFLHLHIDLGEQVQRFASAWHFDSENRFVEFLMRHVDAITPQRLKQIGIGTFVYSGIALTEGIGLMKEKVWAEYLTLCLTIAALPWEIYEIIRHLNWFRIGLLVINILVLLYLVWVIGKNRKERETAKQGG